MSRIAERIAKLSTEKRRLLAQQLQREKGRTLRERIPPQPRDRGPLPLSFSQERLWFLFQLAPESCVYNLCYALRLSGRLNVPALAESLREVVRRHESLRTTFNAIDGKPSQVIHAPQPFPLPVVALEGLTAARRQDEVRRLMRAVSARPFDLARGPLIAGLLLRLAPEEHIVLLTLHHIVFDGWSLGVLIHEVSAIYRALARSLTSPLAELEIQYADFAAWQRQWLTGEVLESLVDYWRDRLAGAPTQLELPTDRPRSQRQGDHANTLMVSLTPPLTAALRNLSSEQGYTLFVTLLSAFAVLIGRASGQPEVMVGTPIANRRHTELETLIGLLLNTLVLRLDPGNGDPSCSHWLERTRDRVLEAYAHQDLPFGILVEQLQPERNLRQTPLYQVLFVLQNAPRDPLELPGLTIQPLEHEVEAEDHDFTLWLWEEQDRLVGRLRYSTELFDATTIRRLMSHYAILLEEIVADPRRRLSELSALSAAERHQLVAEWSDTRRDPRWQGCLHQLVAAQARQTPDAVAIVLGGTQISYAELDRRANRLARRLRARGVGPEAVVGLGVERSPELIVGALGILKAGAAYLPLDPTYPAERLGFMLEDSGARVVVGREMGTGVEVVLVDEDGDGDGVGEGEVGDLAYVIYTSGSTGRPKGVRIRHRALVNFLSAMAERPGLTPADVLLAVTSLSFDIAALEIFLPLLRGARLDLVSTDIAADGPALRAVLARARATVMQATPATWRLLVAAGWQGEERLRVLCGGEALPPDLARELRARCRSGWNLYGPTETTIWSLVERLDGERVTIGRPIANTTVRLLDRQLRPVPIGVVGELFLGGEGLARDYLARPALTAERFLPDPLAASQAAESRLYRTGDLARYLADGRLEFLGRIDHQIKLRGHRIELGEIETVLGRHPGIAEAVVVARDQRLVAYLVPAAGEPTPAIEALRRFLAEQLPDSMVPSLFVTLESLPLTPNRKVDRRALPAPEATRPELGTAYAPPRSDLERTIAGIWQEVLGLDKIGLDDNFFDVGGHSLLMAQVRAKVGRIVGRDLPLVEFFRYPNIRALARHLSGETDERAAPRSAAPRPARTSSEIAIIGMSGRFPGADDVDALWRNLREGVESIRFLSDDELVDAGVDPSVFRADGYVRASAEVRDPDLFDAAFFAFSPREAESLDPQHRVFLECAWHALEHSGHDPARYPGRIGVYAGSGMSRYAAHVFANPLLMESLGTAALTFAVGQDFLATRVSYKLNLTGPSVAVQTACSTSLVAVHLARQALNEGECDMALAGGVTLATFRPRGYRYLAGGIDSPDGHCRAFDAAAQGTVSSSGAAVVVLKRLADALADGDHIHAVVKATAINNDGSLKVGFTAPSEEGQVAVIMAALAQAGVDPETIGYVEAHGTGTVLGDPIEVAALTRAFRTHTIRRGFCALGSIKTNLGHTDTAAGAAGLIKATLAVEHALVPPSLHFVNPNPAIDFAGSPFYVPTALGPWPSLGIPRRAGVSSFGIGGTNAHAILEQAPARPASGPARPNQLLMLSARSEDTLEAMTDNLAQHLREHELPLADVAFTLHLGRGAFEHRRALVSTETEDAAAALASRDRKRLLTATVDRDVGVPPVVFLFPGQGAQYAGMGSELYETEDAFRREVDRCCALLEPRLGIDLREVISLGSTTQGRTRRSAPTAADLEQTAMAQPALFVVEYALARLWMAWGIRPQAMLGHSIGEYVAACLAEVMTLPDALALVAARGRLMQETEPGAMRSVALTAEELAPLLGDEVAMAAINSPGMSVVSGPTPAIEALVETLRERGVEARPLATSHAFHSPLMEPILDRFRDEVARVALRPPRIPYLSNLTGTWIRPEQTVDPDYWVRHLRNTVRFSDGLGTLLDQPARILLEVGPGRTLQTLVRQHTGGKTRRAFSSLRRPQQGRSETEFLLRTLGELWLGGVDVDWTGFYEGQTRYRVPLPTYPFARRRYWIEPGETPLATTGDARKIGKNESLAEWFYEPFWKVSDHPAPLVADGAWLLFVDPGGLGAEMARQLEEAGRDVVTVVEGDAFRRLGRRRYALRPALRADYEVLLAELAEAPARIAHLWGVTPAGTTEDHGQAMDRGFYSLMGLAQALGTRLSTDPVRLGIVTNSVHCVDGREELWPEKAAVLGPCNVIPLEYPQLRTCAVDVAWRGSAPPRELAALLLAELGGELPDPVIAYRARARRVQAWEKVRLDQALDERLPLRQRGVYLITGGLGGLGGVFARFLAQRFQARLALVDRAPTPGNPQALEELGDEVLVLQADVGDEQAMRGIVDQIRQRFGALHGVFHAAGVPGGGVIQRKTPEEAAAVLAAKVRGTRVLDSVLEHADGLDLLVLFSSINAVVGIFGQADYAAANCVLDAFARHFQHKWPDTLTVAINWAAWEEVGMAADAQAGDTETAIHPLLDRCLSARPEGAEYATELRASEHWILAGHRVLGIPTLPGATYLEMARAAFAHLTGERRCELRDVFFLSPMMVADGDRREVRTLLERRDQGFDFRVVSRIDEAGEVIWQDHARGRVGPLAEPPPRRYDLAAIAERCADDAPQAPEVADRDRLVVTGPRWDCLQEIRIGDSEGLARLELAPEFSSEIADFGIHPVLLDVATGLCRGLAGRQDYLPLSYRRVEAKGPLPGTLYSYLRRREGEVAGREAFSVDIALVDETGVEVAAIEQFTMKRVGQAAGELSRTPPAAPPRGRRPEAGIFPAEGIEALRRILSRHSGPQIVVSGRDLHAEIAAARDAARLPAAEPVRRTSHQRPALSTPYVAPRNEIETRLAEIWQDLLGVDQVGIEDDFLELGGHSLLATQLYSRIQTVLGVTVSLPALFEAQTVAEMAELIRGAEAGVEEPATPAVATTIVPVPRHDEMPPSFSQQREWFLEQLEPGNPAYKIAVPLRLEGALNIPVLEAAINEIARRHETLRTTFPTVRGQPVQVIADERTLRVPVVDLSALRPAHGEASAQRLGAAERLRHFDLARGPLLRITCLRLGPQDHVGLITLHHIITDGWSIANLIREMIVLYGAFAAGRPSPLPPLVVQYADYAAAQRQWLQGETLERLLSWWRERLADPPKALPLPTDRPRKPGLFAHSAIVPLGLGAPLSAALRELSVRSRTSRFMTMLAAFKVLLRHYTATDDLCVGTFVAGRNRPEVEPLIGFFINTLALRTDLRGADEPAFADLLTRVREVALGAFAHQELPFEMLLDALEIERSLAHTPLFQVMMVMQNLPLPGGEIPGLRVRPFGSARPLANVDLSLWLEDDEPLSGYLEYNSALFDSTTVVRMRGHFMTLLGAAIANPHARLSALPLLGLAEAHQLLYEWGTAGSPVRATPEPGIHRLFEARAAQSPAAIAVVDGQRRLSYGELDARANQLAHYLRSRGVDPEQIVALCLERRAELLVAVLAVLKAGGAYLNLDPGYPPDRLAFMLEDSAATLVLSDRIADVLPAGTGARILELDAEDKAVAAHRRDRPPEGGVDPDQLAYVVYTSGSAGRPKGVMVSHGSLTATYLAWEDDYRLRAVAGRHLQMASPSFDVFSGDWTRALCSGGRLVLCPRETLLMPEELEALMRREDVDCAEFVPAVARAVMEYLGTTGRTLAFMRLLIVGSDVWHLPEHESLRRLGGPGTRLMDSYGVAEATIDSTFFERAAVPLVAERPVPIGRPFAGNRIYLLDRTLSPVPGGVVGELCLGGVTLARGYLDRPALSAERFVPDPTSASPGSRLYRTGDLARTLADGNVEFLGRMDDQVKIRGFRIEPGEIEAVLDEHPSVAEVAVVARERPAGASLLAYVVLREPAPTTAELRDLVAARLPDYMVPAAFIKLAALPKTPGGKVDRRALPTTAGEEVAADHGYVAPTNDTEEVLIEIFAEVLGLTEPASRPIGIYDHFFKLGGHSLLATRLLTEVRHTFEVELPLREIFQTPTVAGLAAVIGDRLIDQIEDLSDEELTQLCQEI